MNDETLKAYAYVTISKHRTTIVKHLTGKFQTPTQIANDTGILRNHVSMYLKSLTDYGVTECINPEAKKGRLYRLTSKGEEIADKIQTY